LSRHPCIKISESSAKKEVVDAWYLAKTHIFRISVSTRKLGAALLRPPLELTSIAFFFAKKRFSTWATRLNIYDDDDFEDELSCCYFFLID
jgi:hypothetical protein